MTANELVNICGDPGLAHILVMVRRFLNVFYIIGPIVALAGITYHLIRLVFSPDGKKNKPLLKNWLIAFLMLFLIPVLINVVMGLFDSTFQFAACWNAASKVDYDSGNDYFDDTSDDGERNKLDDFSNIDSGTNSNTNTSSNSNSNSDSSENNVVNTRLWVGDSRTVGMKTAVNEDKHDVWSCKTSMGLPWMKSTGIPNIESKISSNSAIIILMGVNDLSNSKSYIKYVNGNAPSWNKKGAKVYFVSVNPTDGNYNYLDANIKSFNSDLKSNLSSTVKFIDSYNYLVKNGFSTTDGLHYNNSTYKKIYNYVVENL